LKVISGAYFYCKSIIYFFLQKAIVVGVRNEKAMRSSGQRSQKGIWMLYENSPSCIIDF